MALGPDAPWLKHANEVASAADSGSHLGPQVGLQPNQLNNHSHDEDETPITDGETPGVTVEKLLDGAPNIASSSTHITANLVSLINDRDQFKFGSPHKCRLRTPYGAARPCSFATFFDLTSYTKHLTLKHISDELSRIRSGQLTMDQAELLVSQEKIRLIEKYEWVCCVPECPMASLTRYEVEKHTYQVHNDMNIKPSSLRRRQSGLQKKTLLDVILDVLAD